MRTTSLLLALTLTAATLAAAETTPAPAITATVKPYSIQLTRTRNFGSSDAPRVRDDDQLNVNLLVSFDPSITSLGWRDLVITEAVTDAGENLTVNSRMGGFSDGYSSEYYGSRSSRERRSYYVNAFLKAPTKACRSIRTLSGTLNLAVAKGNLKRAELKPLKDVLGKTVSLAGIAGADITLDRYPPAKGLRVTMPRDLQTRFRGIECYDSTGARVEAQSSGGGSSGNEVQRHYNADVPDDGTVVLLLYPEVDLVPVRFTIEDIPMPGAELPVETKSGLVVQPVDVKEAPLIKEGEAVPVTVKPGPAR